MWVFFVYLDAGEEQESAGSSLSGREAGAIYRRCIRRTAGEPDRKRIAKSPKSYASETEFSPQK